jgi:inorganic pyrophosphatase
VAGRVEPRQDGAVEQHHLVVEIPRGSRNKYEVDHNTGEVWLDRKLFTSMQYPADYGYLVQTLGEDGDPLDALVVVDDPTFPGCHIAVRAVGVIWMTDEAGPDAKILCVPAGDPRWSDVTDVGHLSSHLVAEIEHFFGTYKEIEPGKESETGGFGGADAAMRTIAEARERYAAQH